MVFELETASPNLSFSYFVKGFFVHFTSSKLTINEHTRVLTRV